MIDKLLIFDEALFEIFRLLQSIFTRFKATKEYITICKLINNNKNN